MHEFDEGPPVEGFRFGIELAPGITAQELGAIWPDDTWLDLSDDALSARLNEYAMAVAQTVSTYATDELPKFVREHYRLGVFALSPIHQARGHRSDIWLTDRQATSQGSWEPWPMDTGCG